MEKIRKKPSESFREYAHRWREIGSQVHPPMDDSEMVEAFIHAQQHPYYEWLINGAGRSFAELIKNGEMVEDGIQTGKIKITTEQGQAGTSYKKPKKESEMAVIYPNFGQYAPVNFIQ